MLFAASYLAWTGRWRGWAFRGGGLPAPLWAFPAAGLLLVLAGLDRLGAVSSNSPVGGLVLVLMVTGLALGLWGSRRIGPRWWRELDPRRVATGDGREASGEGGPGKSPRRPGG